MHLSAVIQMFRKLYWASAIKSALVIVKPIASRVQILTTVKRQQLYGMTQRNTAPAYFDRLHGLRVGNIGETVTYVKHILWTPSSTDRVAFLCGQSWSSHLLAEHSNYCINKWQACNSNYLLYKTTLFAIFIELRILCASLKNMESLETCIDQRRWQLLW